MWNGDYRFVIASLVAKDFKVRYRNMSLGVLWSLLNPLIMMGVLTFIFTKIFANAGDKTYPLSVLCGLVPFNFFALSWLSGTTSVLENAGLIKRVPVPRQVFPVASVFSNCLHLFIQVGLLLVAIIAFGRGVNLNWLWLPVIWGLEILFVLGLAFLFSALNVFIRDIRYIVESCNTVLFWLVPIFYSFERIPHQYRLVYQFNPVAALVLMMRTILLKGEAPEGSTLLNLVSVSCFTFALGLLVFRSLRNRFYEYL